MLFFLQTVIRCEIIFYYWTCLPSYLLNLHIDFDHFGGTLDEFALLFLPVDFQKKIIHGVVNKRILAVKAALGTKRTVKNCI